MVGYRFKDSDEVAVPEALTGHFKDLKTRGFTPELKQWMRDNRVDMLFHFAKEFYDVFTLDMRNDFIGQPKEWDAVLPSQAAPALKKAEDLNTEPGPGISSGAGYRNGPTAVNVFRSREGVVGYYQLRAFSDMQGHGVIIRSKQILTQKAEAPASQPGITFGPVIERTLKSPAVDRANSYIDLESGNVVPLPAEINLKDDKAVSAWAAENGVDAVADTSQEIHGLLGFQLHFVQVPDSEWAQATSSSIVSNVVAQEFHSFKFGGEWPRGTNDTGHWAASANTFFITPRSRTFAFRTRENSLGVLQLLDVSDEPNGFVEFRYKLVWQTNTTQSP